LNNANAERRPTECFLHFS